MTEARRAVIEQLADAIAAERCGHTLRVAIDGRSASGKTTLANELVGPLERRGRPVIRGTIDGFHHPRDVRYANGRGPEQYYRHSFDTDAARRRLLDPLGPAGDGWYRSAAFDFRTEEHVEHPPRQAAPGSVLLFDGVFAMRPELDDAWEYRVYVDASASAILDRARERDAGRLGDADAVAREYHDRYLPGQQLYIDRVQPHTRADVVLFNDNPAQPTLRWQRQRQPC